MSSIIHAEEPSYSWRSTRKWTLSKQAMIHIWIGTDDENVDGLIESLVEFGVPFGISKDFFKEGLQMNLLHRFSPILKAKIPFAT